DHPDLHSFPTRRSSDLRHVRGIVGLDQKNLRTAHLVERGVEGGHRRWNERIPARWRREVETPSEAAGMGSVRGEGAGEGPYGIRGRALIKIRYAIDQVSGTVAGYHANQIQFIRS